MKKNYLLFAALCCGIYITTTSSSGGYNQNMTGSHGGGTGCGGCHGSAATAAITVSVELDSAGTVVTSYKPGMTYKLRVKATNTGTTTLPKFGLQLSAVTGTGTASVNAGTLTALTSGTSIRTGTGSIKYLSQTSALAATTGTGTTGTTYVAEGTWVAPAAGTGTVKAYGLINAVNGNNTDDNNDKWNTANASFTEQVATTGVAEVAADKYVVYPNPASGIVKVTGYEGRMQLIDMQGRAVAAGNGQIDMATLASGVYMLQYFPGGNAFSTRVVKQ